MFDDWLRREIDITERHIKDFETGATVKKNGVDVTEDWNAEYTQRLDELRKQLALLSD